MGQERLGIANASVVQAVGLYGGGIAASGNVCGALLGGIAALSSVLSRGSLDQAEDPAMYATGSKLVRRFEQLTAKHGGIRCQDIARADWTDPEAVRKYWSDPDSRRAVCTEVVGETAQALGEVLEERGL